MVALGVVGNSQNLNFVENREPGAVEAAAAIFRGYTIYDEHWVERPCWATTVPTRFNGMLTGSGTRLSITYATRPDATWADGQPLRPDDFMFAYEMSLLLPPSTIPPWLNRLNFRTEGGDRVTVTCNPLLGDPRGQMLPLPAHVLRPQLEKSGQAIVDLPFNRQPLGCGPFRVAGNEPGRLDLVPSPAYHLGKPHLVHLVLRFFSDETSRLQALQAGAVDAAADLPATELSQLGALPAMTLDSVPDGNVWCLFYPTDSGAFRNLKVRRSLSRVVDRAALVHRWQGMAAPVPESWLPSQHVAYVAAIPADSGPMPAHPRTALTRGTRISLVVLDHGADWPPVQDVVRSWEGTGLQVEVTSVTRAELVSRLAQGKRDAIVLAPLPVDPRTSPQALFSTAQIPSPANHFLGMNLSGWRNAANERLCRLVDTAATPLLQIRQLQAQQRLVAEQMPFLPLFYELQYSVHDKRLEGWKPRGLPGITWNAEDWQWK